MRNSSGALTSERKNWPMPRNGSYETHDRRCAPRGSATGILDFHISRGDSVHATLRKLAYALTVHKAQGSEFQKVFVVLPKNCRPLSRELLYTALTRSRRQLVLLIEGDN